MVFYRTVQVDGLSIFALHDEPDAIAGLIDDFLGRTLGR